MPYRGRYGGTPTWRGPAWSAAKYIGPMVASAVSNYYKRNYGRSPPKRRRYNKKRGYNTFRKRKGARRRRRYGKSRRQTGHRTQPSLARRLYLLQKRVEAGMGTYIYKYRDSGTVKCSVNAIDYQTIANNQLTQLEGAIDNLPTFNPALPGTFTFVDFTTGTQQKEIEFASCYSHIYVQNNYNVPVKVTIYKCAPKDDTNITPKQAVINGLTDMGSGLTEQTPMLTPFDSSQFRDLWSVLKTTKRTLKAGQGFTVKNFVRSFQYDPSFGDSHSLANQSRYGAHHYLVRVEGVVGHDTTNAEYGNLQGGIDYVHVMKFVIKYDAGADIKYIEVDDGNNSFTNGGRVSQLETNIEQYQQS